MIGLASLFGSRPVTRIGRAPPRREDDWLAIEEPLEIRVGVDDEQALPVAVTMRTPGHDADLAAGFCLTEGIVERGDQIERIAPCAAAVHGNIINVILDVSAAERRAGQIADATRPMYMSSSCGLCGKQTLDRIEQHIGPVNGDFTVDQGVLMSLPGRMRQAQPTFERTGGLHAAAVFSLVGDLVVLREDVGRHNALDKVIGNLLMSERIPVDPAVLLVSGRSSFEIMQKAAAAGIAVVAAVGAPSSLAVDLAGRMGQTLIGFLREDRMNIYTHPHRVRLQ